MNERATISQPSVTEEPWHMLADAIEARDAERAEGLLNALGAADTARTINRLSSEEQDRLLTLLAPDEAADVIEEISAAQAGELVEDLPAGEAAKILARVPSVQRAELLRGFDPEYAEQVVADLPAEQAEQTRRVLSYEADTAGGLMAGEYLAYRQDRSVRSVIHEMQRRRERYRDYDVQYLYVVDERHRLIGVLRMRDLLLTERDARLHQIMLTNPYFVRDDAPLTELAEFFDEHRLRGVPVVDGEGGLLGLVTRDAVDHARAEQADRSFRGISGIIGGEEFRSMPLWLRSGRRLSWLGPNIVLNIIAASVIALYQDTLEAAITLAVFLPMISDMSGCSGNQAVGVSMRELTLGLIRPTEILRVIGKESGLGLINGIALGSALGLIAGLYDQSLLGVVVGGALAINTVVAATLGGVLPLALKRFGLDPAMVAGPILTTVTDMCGFFLALSLTEALLV